MPPDEDDNLGRVSASAEPTRFASETPESGTLPVLLTGASSFQTPAKPLRKGLRAEIKFLETDPETVSRRARPAGGVDVTQGDIFKDVTFVEDVFGGKAGVIHVSQIVFPHVVVLTQACDLAHAESLLSVLAASLKATLSSPRRFLFWVSVT